MEKGQSRPPEASASQPAPSDERVLATGLVEGQRYEVLEYADGALAIRINGTVPPGYHWPPGKVESCVQTYLQLLRREDVRRV